MEKCHKTGWNAPVQTGCSGACRLPVTETLLAGACACAGNMGASSYSEAFIVPPNSEYYMLYTKSFSKTVRGI